MRIKRISTLTCLKRCRFAFADFSSCSTPLMMSLHNTSAFPFPTYDTSSPDVVSWNFEGVLFLKAAKAQFNSPYRAPQSSRRTSFATQPLTQALSRLAVTPMFVTSGSTTTHPPDSRREGIPSEGIMPAFFPAAVQEAERSKCLVRWAQKASMRAFVEK